MNLEELYWLNFHDSDYSLLLAITRYLGPHIQDDFRNTYQLDGEIR